MMSASRRPRSARTQQPSLPPSATIVCGRAHEVQSSPGSQGDHGAGILDNDDIVEKLRTLIHIRDGKGGVDDIDTSAIGGFVPSEMAENAFRGLIRVERAVKERLSLAESEGLMPQDMINAKPGGGRQGIL